MKKKNSRLGDMLAVGIYFAAYYISLNVLAGLTFDILGVLFFAAMAYGIVCLWKKKKFIFM